MTATTNPLPSPLAANQAGPDPDADVLEAMAAGDASGLALLMERHLATIKSLAWYMLHDDMAAEDVAQDVFLKAWMMAPKWTAGEAKFITWMRRVATNSCLDRLRKKRETLPGLLPDLPSESRAADAVLVDQEQSARVQSAIGALPERQRAAITLCHFQNLSQTEAAQILDISVTAYESLLSRGRHALRRALFSDSPQAAILGDPS